MLAAEQTQRGSVLFFCSARMIGSAARESKKPMKNGSRIGSKNRKPTHANAIAMATYSAALEIFFTSISTSKRFVLLHFETSCVRIVKTNVHATRTIQEEPA